MNKRIQILIMACALFGAEMGCTKHVRVPAPAFEDDPAVKAIHESSSQIRESLLVLREKEQAYESPQVHPTPSDQQLLMPITLKAWNGPAKKALDYIGMLVGYKITTQGRPPAIEPLVSINSIQKPAHLILQDIGTQIGDSAGIQVKESTKEIVLVFTK